MGLNKVQLEIKTTWLLVKITLQLEEPHGIAPKDAFSLQRSEYMDLRVEITNSSTSMTLWALQLQAIYGCMLGNGLQLEVVEITIEQS